MFGSLRKIYISAASENNRNFNNPEQGVWQLMPVEGQQNVFFLKNKLYQEYLVAKYKSHGKSHGRKRFFINLKLFLSIILNS